MKHAHLCGNTAKRDREPWAWDESQGCGLIWYHDDTQLDDTRINPAVRLKMSVLMHTCPRCKRQAWVQLPDPIGMQLTELAA